LVPIPTNRMDHASCILNTVVRRQSRVVMGVVHRMESATELGVLP
jgi:hypothetical protein